MQVRLAVAVAAVLFLPTVASAQVARGSTGSEEQQFSSINAHPAECSRLRRQIDHFAGMRERALVAENELWVTRLESHLGLLLGMQAARCPNDIPVDTTGRAFKELLKFAAKAAVAYFTFGAAGF